MVETKEQVKAFQVQATLEGVSLLKDNGVSLRFHTNELTPEDKTAITRYYQQFGWLLFGAQEHDEEGLRLELIRKDTGGKSPSQRLRAVLFVAYQQSGQLELTFEQYYDMKMERFINSVKDKLV